MITAKIKIIIRKHAHDVYTYLASFLYGMPRLMSLTSNYNITFNFNAFHLKTTKMVANEAQRRNLIK